MAEWEAEKEAVSEDRDIPQNAKAEHDVLGSILLDPAKISLVVSILSQGDFFSDKHRRIYGAMLALRDRAIEIDTTTLTEELNGGEPGVDAAYLSWLMDKVPDIGHIEDYARIVKEKATRRWFIRLGEKLGEDARSEDKSTATLFEETRDGLADVEAAGEPKGKWTSPDAILRGSPLRNSPKVRTGFGKLDKAIGGGIPIGAVFVLSGAPGSGKTTLAIQIARAAMEQLGARVVGFFGDEGLEGAAGKLGQQIGLQREDLDAGEENALASLQAYTAGDSGEN